MNKGTNIALSLLLGVTFVSGVILSSSYVSADDIIDNVAITVESSCSMSGNIDTAHTANLKNNTYSGTEGSIYENGIGKTTLTTFCNDQNGFSIYAVGYTGNVAGNTNLVGASTGSTISTGTAISGDTSNWAMKVTKVDNPGGQQPDVTYNPQNMTITNSFNNFHAVPAEYTKVAEYHAQAGSSATDQGPGALGAKIETTYATYVSADQYADTYTGQVKYVMVHPYDHATPVEPPTSCATQVPGAFYLQDINTTNRSTIVNNMEYDTAYYLVDSRDGQPYCVSKLRDDNVWMLENLRLDLTNSSVQNAMYSNSDNNYDTKTDASNTTLGYLFNGGGTKSDQYAMNGISSNWNGGYIYSDPKINTTNQDIIPNDNISQTGHYKVGNYYNFCAASAGSYCYGNATSSGAPSGDAAESICPKGWRMPVGNNTSEYQTLYNNSYYNNYTNYRTALRLPLSGYYHNSTAYEQGSYGIFWSSSIYDHNNRMYGLGVIKSSEEIIPLGYGYRNDGVPLRCILGS